jgi:2-polyprenyl-6-methoxyphenol hydroxylase-like FAD-dependent oxidoreductase
MNQPVLIVGAGPVGLTMAAALTHQGINVRLIDKSPSASDKSKALVLWCRSLELLNGLGLAQTFVAHGMKLGGGSIYADGKRVVHLDLTSDESPFGFPLMIPQNLTEQLLTEHLASAGIHVQRQVELVTFTETADAVRCTLRDGAGVQEVIETPFLLGCDGAHSTVRHTMGVQFTGSTEPNNWMLADVHIDGPLARDEVSVYWHSKGVVAFFPIDGTRTRMIADMGPVDDSAPVKGLTLEQVQSIVDERGPSGLSLSDPIWLAYFHINERKVSDYRKGRVMLCGDAAHIHSPAGGQGMNTGMQDAFNLAWKLALILRGQGKADTLLHSYSRERSEVGDQVLKNAQRFTTVATLSLPIERWLRNHIAPLLGALPIFREKIRDDWFELSINYRHSVLSQDLSHVGGLHAGDRMCDAPLSRLPDHQPSTLFDQLDASRHTLVLLPGAGDTQSVSDSIAIAAEAAVAFPNILSTHLVLLSDADVAVDSNLEISRWIDVTGRLYDKLHSVHPMLVLIRPDGYIGFRAQTGQRDALLKYMDTYLNRGTSV